MKTTRDRVIRDSGPRNASRADRPAVGVLSRSANIAVKRQHFEILTDIVHEQRERVRLMTSAVQAIADRTYGTQEDGAQVDAERAEPRGSYAILRNELDALALATANLDAQITRLGEL